MARPCDSCGNDLSGFTGCLIFEVPNHITPVLALGEMNGGDVHISLCPVCMMRVLAYIRGMRDAFERRELPLKGEHF
jgi:hypothetical protein